MPRRPRFSTAGYVFHVLNRAVARQKIFDTEHDYDDFLCILEEARQAAPMRILGFCVMPNHWHLLLWPETDEALSEFMHRLSVTHVQRWHAFHGTAGTGSLYQGRFKSFPIQEDEHFLTVSRYVERNPLRANLVSRAELWRWSSLWQWRIACAAVALADWPVARPSDWIKLVNEPQTEAELGAVRNSVIRSRPFGDRSWARTTAKSLGLERTLRVAGHQPKL